jgi:hypothetical protein
MRPRRFGQPSGCDIKLDQLYNNWGEDKPIIFSCPEPSKNINYFMRILQENVLLMHSTEKEFTLGILSSFHRFPKKCQVGSDKETEDLYLGCQLAQQPILDAHMWPLIDKVTVLKTQLMGQFGVGGYGREPKLVKRSSHYGVVFFTSQNNTTTAMLDNMIMHKELDDWDHPYSLGWGTHKTDWQFYRDQIKAQKDLRLPLYKYMHCPFPLLQLASDPNELQAALYEAGTLSLRISMDILEGESFWELNTLVKQFKDLIPDLQVRHLHFGVKPMPEEVLWQLQQGQDYCMGHYPDRHMSKQLGFGVFGVGCWLL